MPRNVQSVERAAAILRFLAADGGSRPLADLAQMLSLSKSTAHGIVRTLVDVGLLAQDAGSSEYRLHPQLRVGPIAPMDVNELRARATNWVDALAGRTRLSVRLAVLPDLPPAKISAGLIAHHVFSASPAPQRLEIGESLHLTATAAGKILLAFTPRGMRVLRYLRPEVLTTRTMTEPQALRRESAAVRRRGFATDREEFAVGSTSVAVPVRSHGGLVVAALGVRGSRQQVFGSGGEVHPELLKRLHDAARGTGHALMAERW